MNLPTLAWTMFLFTILTFGNGPLLIPLLQQDYVLERGVITEEQLLYAFTIARVTPGQANLYIASIGYMLFGVVGAVVAVVAILLPGYTMVPLLRYYQRFRERAYISGFIKGLTATSVGLILAATVQIGRDTLSAPMTWVVFGTTIIMVQFLKLNVLLSLFLASLGGVLAKLVLG